MTRKIPAKRSKTIRDPLDQIRAKEAKLRNAREDRPVKDEDQPMSRKLVEALKRNETFMAKQRPNKKKARMKKNTNGVKLLSTDDFVDTLKTEGEVKKSYPAIKQNPGESSRKFRNRVYNWCQDIKNEFMFEKKYGVEILRNPETKKVTLEKKKKNDFDELVEKEKVKRTIKDANPKKRKLLRKQEAERVALKEEQRKKLLARRMKLKKYSKKKTREEEEVKDFPAPEKVKFGDVVDRPPEFSVLPRKAVDKKNLKNLIFNQMLIQGKNAEKTKIKENKGELKKKAGVKLKDLPMHERREIENQQKVAIAAYRLMKANKLEAKVKI